MVEKYQKSWGGKARGLIRAQFTKHRAGPAPVSEGRDQPSGAGSEPPNAGRYGWQGVKGRVGRGGAQPS